MFEIQYFSLCGGMVDVSVLGTDVLKTCRFECDLGQQILNFSMVFSPKNFQFFSPLLKLKIWVPFLWDDAIFLKICFFSGTLLPNKCFFLSIHGRVVDCTALIMRFLQERRWFKPNWMQLQFALSLSISSFNVSMEPPKIYFWEAKLVL